MQDTVSTCMLTHTHTHTHTHTTTVDLIAMSVNTKEVITRK